MLYDFLLKHQASILEMTEAKAILLAGARPSSDQLKRGLPIFYAQLLEVLQSADEEESARPSDSAEVARAADASNEEGMAMADGKPHEAEVAKQAGIHGSELLRLGYTLSHVVHAYGAICQSITELATQKMFAITSAEFRKLNGYLDVAIAGAVTEYQSLHRSQEMRREVKHLGFLAHELRNTLTSVNVAFGLIKRGTVGIGGNTGQIMVRGLKRLEELIDRSLTEVRLSVDPELHVETGNVLQLVDQIVASAEIEAHKREQILEVAVDPELTVEADQQLMYSAISNLVQNAIKFTPAGGRIQIRGQASGESAMIEVEDECGGLNASAEDLFKDFAQKNENRSGLGLGLTIVKRSVTLNRGTIDVQNLPGRGCVFKIELPRVAQSP